LGPLENLNLSGWEPFLRPEFAEICSEFIRNNHARQIYCPTNGWYTQKTEAQLGQLLHGTDLELFTIELSIDGMPEFHDRFRAKKGSFDRLLETYDMLAGLQQNHPQLQIHSITTATAENIGQIVPLSRFLHERCPGMNRHNIALLRGERKRATLLAPSICEYQDVTREVGRIWAGRKDRSAARVVDPMLHWAKAETSRRGGQVVPCRAGILTGVVYANGDVSLCEQHTPLGNLRSNTFLEIWHSPQAVQLRRRIADKECSCTNEIFLWSSLAFQPVPLMRALGATGTLREALVTLIK
jgi:MoaA/NifB/PqqE/SkfB family radical SAM enzyme